MLVSQGLTLLASIVVLFRDTRVREDNPLAGDLADSDLIHASTWSDRQCSDQAALDPVPDFNGTVIRRSHNLHRVGRVIEQGSDGPVMAISTVSNGG